MITFLFVLCLVLSNFAWLWVHIRSRKKTVGHLMIVDDEQNPTMYLCAYSAGHFAKLKDGDLVQVSVKHTTFD